MANADPARKHASATNVILLTSSHFEVHDTASRDIVPSRLWDAATAVKWRSLRSWDLPNHPRESCSIRPPRPPPSFAAALEEPREPIMRKVWSLPR